MTGRRLVAASESAPSEADPSHDCAGGAVSEASQLLTDADEALFADFPRRVREHNPRALMSWDEEYPDRSWCRALMSDGRICKDDARPSGVGGDDDGWDDVILYMDHTPLCQRHFLRLARATHRHLLYRLAAEDEWDVANRAGLHFRDLSELREALRDAMIRWGRVIPPKEAAQSKPRKRTRRKGISAQTRFTVFERDGFCCHYCGRSAPNVELHVDHIIPKAAGGLDDMSNYVAACADCNLGKHTRILFEQVVA